MTVACAHPRPALNMPSGSPARLRWQPPTYIPENLADMRRFMAEQYRAIYNELMGAQMARAVVPLIDSLIQAQSGQIIQGIADGQTIVLPATVPGQLDDVRVVIDAVVNPVTVVDPAGNATTLATPGVFDFNAANAQPYGTPPTAAALGGGTFVVETADPTNLPAAYEATDSAELDWTFSSGLVTLAIIDGSVALTRLANQAAETFLGNFGAAPGPPTARAGTSVAGAGLAYTAGGTLAVGSSTSIVVGADDVQRAALTGDVTAAQNVNTTAFRSFTARSVLANATNAAGAPTELQGTTAHHLLKVNAAGTALVFEALPLAAFPTMAAGTVLANVTAGTAVPTAHSLTTLAGGGLTYTNVTGIMAVGAGDGIDVNADDVAVDVTDIVDNVSITEVATNNIQRAALTGAIAATAGSNSTLFAGIRDNGVAENDRTNLNFIAGTNTTATVTDDAGNDELEVRFNVDDFPLAGLADQAAETFNGNFTAGSAPPTARAGSSVAGAGLTYTAGGTLAVGSSTSITVNADDVQRAALTGAIAASANSNATVFAGIRDNGAAENDRSNLNFLNGNGVNVTITDDAGNDELEIAFAIDLADIDSTSIVVNGTVLERPALTGAIAASQNSNATVFAGIRDNGSAETDRTNLNFVSSTSCTAVVTDDAGNDELEVTYQRAALTGEVTAPANSNATSITRSTNFVWTGTHNFQGALTLESGVAHALESGGSFNADTSTEIVSEGSIRLGTGTDVQSDGRLLLRALTSPRPSLSGTVEAQAVGARSVLAVNPSSDPILDGISGASDGQLVLLVNTSSTSNFTIRHDQAATAANGFVTPGGVTFTVLSRSFCIIWYDGAVSRWRICAG